MSHLKPNPSTQRVSSYALLLCAFVVLSGCGEQSVQAPEDQTIRPARIFIVDGNSATQARSFVGRVEAAQSIDVSFEVTGPLEQLPVLEGQTVSKGALVAALDPTDFELAIREAEVQLQISRQDLQRKQRVLKQRGIARSVVDDAQSNYELHVVRLDRAKQSLRDSRLIAPFDAYIARRYVDRFVKVAVGQSIVKLNDLNTLLIVANIPENLLATANEEQIVSLSAEFDFAKDQAFPLTVHENRGEADSVSQTYEVSFAMQSPAELNILPGMTATVKVLLDDQTTGEANSSVRRVGNLIPASALVAAGDGSSYVWIFDAQTQIVTKRVVELGMPKQAGIEILSGLAQGDMIVATGAAQLQDGMRIAVLGEPNSLIVR